MMRYTCSYCGESISEESISARHYSEAKLQSLTERDALCCGRLHADVLRKQRGGYKQMSVAGRDARSKAVTKSNSEKPRRAKKG